MNPTVSTIPNPFLDDTMIAMPPWQRRLHVLSEAAMLLMLPRLFAAARDAGPKHKNFLLFLAYGTLVVDGVLLYRWLRDYQLSSLRGRADRAFFAAQSIRNPPPAGPGAPIVSVTTTTQVPPATQPRLVVMQPSWGY